MYILLPLQKPSSKIAKDMEKINRLKEVGEWRDPDRDIIIKKTPLFDHFIEVVTQNIDDLHERGGSTRVTHLHGELRKLRIGENSITGVPKLCEILKSEQL